MLPIITDLTKGSPANDDASEDWMKASDDAQKLSTFYKRLAADQHNAYEKTMNRIMTNHNGHNFRYRSPDTGRFISKERAAANDKIDAYQRTLDRIMNMHNDHENAPGPGDADNENRIIHDYNPEIPQSVYRNMKKFVEKEGRPIEKLAKPESAFSSEASDQRNELDVLKSINNDTTNILDTIHRISYTLDDYTDEDKLRARERDNKSGHDPNQEFQESILAGLSRANRDGKITKSKPGLLDTLTGLGKDLLWGGGLMVGGLGVTALTHIYGNPKEEKPDGGYTGKGKTPGTRADSPGRYVEPVSKSTVHGDIAGRGVGYVPATKIPTPVVNDKDFQKKVTELAKEFNMAEDDVYRVMSFETGGTFDPAIRNKSGSSGTGLIQFMGPTAREMGTTTDKLAAMTRAQQMDYVEKYLKNKHLDRIKNPTVDDLYLKIYKPKLAGHDPNEIVAQEGSLEYRQNHGAFDTNHTGKYAIKDITNRIKNTEVPGVGKYTQPVKYSETHAQMRDRLDAKVVEALKNAKGRQVKFKDGDVAGTGSVTVQLPPVQNTIHNHYESPKTQEKRRPPPAKSDWWDEWKSYFGL